MLFAFVKVNRSKFYRKKKELFVVNGDYILINNNAILYCHIMVIQ